MTDRQAGRQADRQTKPLTDWLIRWRDETESIYTDIHLHLCKQWTEESRQIHLQGSPGFQIFSGHWPSPGVTHCIVNLHSLCLPLCRYFTVKYTWNKVSPHQTRQTVDSCFGLVGPHQHRVCLAAPLCLDLNSLGRPEQLWFWNNNIHHKPHKPRCTLYRTTQSHGTDLPRKSRHHQSGRRRDGSCRESRNHHHKDHLVCTHR